MSGKKNSDSLSNLLALDIGSSFVKCILARPLEYEKKGITSGKMQVLGFSKVAQSRGNMKNGGIASISGVIDTCEEAISKLERITGERAGAVVVGISGEFVKSSVTTIRYHRDFPKKAITELELGELLEKIESRSKQKAHEEVSLELNNPDSELSLVNSALVSFSIDGYRVNNPVGFKGSEAIIEYYTAFAPTIAVSAIEKVCVELELDLLAIAAEPFAMCRACLGDETEADFSAILIDIGGGTTNVAVIDDGEIAGTKMFNFGGDNFTHTIAEAFGIRPSTAEKYKVNLEDESLLSDSIINKTVSALNRSLPVWLGGVSLALEEFHNVLPLPPCIFLSGGSSKLFPLEELLATSDWFRELPFEKRPLIHTFDPFELPDFTFIDDLEKDPEIDRSFIATFGLLRVASDTIMTSPEKTSLKAKLEKLLSR